MSGRVRTTCPRDGVVLTRSTAQSPGTRRDGYLTHVFRSHPTLSPRARSDLADAMLAAEVPA